MNRLRKIHERRGFSLLELLVVVAIIGIIAAILIPNRLTALQKAKQKRTVADMRNTGTAWMSWLTDQVGAASAGAGKTWVGGSTTDISYAKLFGYLHPSNSFFYMQEVPEEDGWKYDFMYGKNDNLLASNVLIICSGGRDGTMTNPSNCAMQTHNVAPFVATDYDKDIVWADGYFVAWPGQVSTN